MISILWTDIEVCPYSFLKVGLIIADFRGGFKPVSLFKKEPFVLLEKFAIIIRKQRREVLVKTEAALKEPKPLKLLEYMKRKTQPNLTVEDARKILSKVSYSLSKHLVKEREG